MEPEFPLLTKAPSESSHVKRLWFIRHGETPQNSMNVLQGGGIDPELSQLGAEQSMSLAKRLVGETIDLFVSSSMKRAKQTLDYVVKSHPNVKKLEFKELNELCWGVWEGTDISQDGLQNMIKNWNIGNFEVHGRLLRIILSSLLHQDLHYMASFTHHNTTINIIDVVIENSQEEASNTLRAVQHLKQGLSKKESKIRVYDDNLGITDASDAPTQKRPESVAKTCIKHPERTFFIPVSLDDHAHLMPDIV